MSDRKKAYAVQWHAKNKERIAEKRRLLFDTDEKAKAEYKAKRAEYYKNNKEAFAKRSAKSWVKNKVTLSERRKSTVNHKEKYVSFKLKFDYLSPEKKIAIKKKASKRSKGWRDRNPDKVCEFNLLRRKREQDNVTHEEQLLVEKWIRKVKRTKLHTCCYCDREISKVEVHIDHILPLAAGGHHKVENLCVACAPCNLSKGAKIIGISWFPKNYLVDGSAVFV